MHGVIPILNRTHLNSDAKNPSTSSDASSNLTTAAVTTFESPQSYRNSHDSDFSNDSAAFEDLLTQLKSTNLQKLFKSKRAPESPFVISDSSSSESESESTCDPTFYHRIENSRLRKSTEELVASLRRQLRFDTSDDTDDQEEHEVSQCSSETDTSERCFKHTPSNPQSIQKTQSLTVPKSVKTPQSWHPFKVLQSPDVQVVGTTSGKKSPLPFIYSLGKLNHKSSGYPENRQRHPSAERLLKNFKKNREELANRLLAYFNEVVFDKKLRPELKLHICII
uniref:SprT-like domain-containing protein n=1 Tax=Mesocestoides corti TaxID=53468 RepID=A0A5K3FQT3_MESCO